MCRRHTNSWNQYIINDSQSDLMLLYQEVLADIRHWKNQQWIITSYVAGIYIGLFTIVEKLSMYDLYHDVFIKVSSIIFTIIVFLVMLGGCYFLYQYSHAIYEERELKEKIIKRNETLRSVLEPREYPKKDVEIFTFSFMSFIIFGGVFTWFSMIVILYY